VEQNSTFPLLEKVEQKNLCKSTKKYNNKTPKDFYSTFFKSGKGYKVND
jgi:hypothetical protein